MSNNNNSGSSGIGFAELLFVVFLILKLTNVIDWSWLWVTSPIWIVVLIAIVIAIIIS